jgi:glycosyltransferase involved in cell wall biosynthesis
MRKHQTPNTVHRTLSVVLSTFNEEQNIGACLDSVKDMFAYLPVDKQGEIIVFDEFSTDRTRKIARNYGAKVYKYKHKTNFHETKQCAIEKAKGDWILQLDADERVTPKLAKEIRAVMTNCHSEFISESIPKRFRNEKGKLFERHQKLIEERENISPRRLPNGLLRGGKRSDKVFAFFIPRLNFFLGKPIKHAGVYPDGVIRLFKKGKARLPGKSVHELMEVDGKVGWLFNDLEHHESPTLKRYFNRMNRYTDLHATDLKERNVPKTPIYYMLYTVYYPSITFLRLYIRHLGFLDGVRGLLWSLFSSLHFPIAYYKYWKREIITV